MFLPSSFEVTNHKDTILCRPCAQSGVECVLNTVTVFKRIAVHFELATRKPAVGPTQGQILHASMQAVMRAKVSHSEIVFLKIEGSYGGLLG
jgi:hypothetical protein